MKEKMEKIRGFLADSTTISNHELVLALAVGVLGGMVFGLLTSPRKTTTIGSNNGNNSPSNPMSDWEAWEEYDED